MTSTPDMPSEVSHSAVVDITFRPRAFVPRKHNTAAVERQAAFFGPTVANGVLRTWPDLQLAPPSRD